MKLEFEVEEPVHYTGMPILQFEEAMKILGEKDEYLNAVLEMK